MKYFVIIGLVLLFSCDSGLQVIPDEATHPYLPLGIGNYWEYYDGLRVISFSEPFEENRFIFKFIEELDKEWDLDEPVLLATFRSIDSLNPFDKSFVRYYTKISDGYLIGRENDKGRISPLLFIPDTLKSQTITRHGIKTKWVFFHLGKRYPKFTGGEPEEIFFGNLWEFTSTGPTSIVNGSLNPDYTFVTLSDTSWTLREMILNSTNAEK